MVAITEYRGAVERIIMRLSNHSSMCPYGDGVPAKIEIFTQQNSNFVELGRVDVGKFGGYTHGGYAALCWRRVSPLTTEKIKKTDKRSFTYVQLRDIIIWMGNWTNSKSGQSVRIFQMWNWGRRKRWCGPNDPLRGVKNDVKAF